jgi:hypothetical protein
VKPVVKEEADSDDVLDFFLLPNALALLNFRDEIVLPPGSCPHVPLPFPWAFLAT